MRRVLNALYRGGVAAEIRPDVWAVWRGTDRRRRQVGTLPGAHIDLLRLHGFLTSLPSEQGCVLCWQAAAPYDLEHAMTVLHRPVETQPFLDQLILFGGLSHERSSLAQTALGIRLDCGMMTRASIVAPEAVAACMRLTAITECLSTQDCQFLHQFLNEHARKAELVEQFSLRPDAVRTKAINILRSMAETYQPEVSA
ncbi:MAG: hypothetical protein AAGL97_16385 [Pseudomonadota bacterium]